MADIKTEIDQFRVDMGLAHQIIHGDETAQVTTDSGPRNSFARDVKEQLTIPNNDTAANMAAAQLAETGALAAEAGSLANKTAAASSATTATTKAAESAASASAANADRVLAETAKSAAQTAESNAVAVVTGGTASLPAAPGLMPIADAKGHIDLAWNLPVMTKAQFDALRDQRKQQLAGSGFVEMGKQYITANSALVNDGLWVPDPTWGWGANHIAMGTNHASATGTSKTDSALCCVDGVNVLVRNVGANDSQISKVLLPDAPVATNLVVNGADLVDTTGWSGGAATVTVSNGELVVTGDGTVANHFAQYSVTGAVGQKYLLEYEITELSPGDTGMLVSGATFDKNNLTYSYPHKLGFHREWITCSSAAMQVRPHSGTVANATAKFDNISLIPVAEVNRTDLVFLEVWHEKISDKDVVYPYGNVQFGATTHDGIALSNTVEVQGYSAFGNWDTVTKGYGVIWSTLSAVNKAKFVQDPLNSIYNDNGVLVQVRYRVRVVKGPGDKWAQVDPLADTYLLYSSVNTNAVKPQGKLTAPQGGADLNNWNLNEPDKGYFKGVGEPKGAYVISSEAVGVAHYGLCFALPIALVTRRNQGAYHPVLNSRGTSVLWQHDGTANAQYWYSAAAKTPRTTMDCFDIGATTAAGKTTGPFTQTVWGAIGSGWQGNPQGRFYDAIYADDIQDLRNRAAKVTDLNRTLEKYFQQAVAGTLRGTEKAKRLAYTTATQVATAASTAAFDFVSGDIPAFVAAGTTVWLEQDNGSYVKRGVITKSSTLITFDAIAGRKAKSVAIFEEVVETQSSGEILCCDIIGDPVNYFRGYYDHWSSATAGVVTGEVVRVDALTTGTGTVGHFYERVAVDLASTDLQTVDYTTADWKDLGTDRPGSWVTEGVYGTPLLVHPDTGVSLIPDGTSKTFKLSRKCSAVPILWLTSSDQGNSWANNTSGLTGPYSAAGNSITSATLNTAGRTHLIFYTTKANGWEAAANAEVLALGDVWAGNTDSVGFGNALSANLIGKVPTKNATDNFTAVSLIGAAIAPTDGKMPTYWGGDATTHPVVNLPGDANSPAAKALPYLTRANGRLYLQALFKEMKFDVDWGDDSKFNVVDNVSAVTDDNGNSVLVGQKRIALPFFIGDSE